MHVCKPGYGLPASWGLLKVRTTYIAFGATLFKIIHRSLLQMKGNNSDFLVPGIWYCWCAHKSEAMFDCRASFWSVSMSNESVGEWPPHWTRQRRGVHKRSRKIDKVSYGGCRFQAMAPHYIHCFSVGIHACKQRCSMPSALQSPQPCLPNT